MAALRSSTHESGVVIRVYADHSARSASTGFTEAALCAGR